MAYAVTLLKHTIRCLSSSLNATWGMFAMSRHSKRTERAQSLCAASHCMHSHRQMLNRRNTAESVGETLQQCQTISTHGRIVDIDHHAFEKRIDLRA